WPCRTRGLARHQRRRESVPPNPLASGVGRLAIEVRGPVLAFFAGRFAEKSMRTLWLAVALSAGLCACQALAQGQWAVPRLANGQPDLQGTWENNSATPLERPAELAGKPLLTEDELAALQT